MIPSAKNWRDYWMMSVSTIAITAHWQAGIRFRRGLGAAGNEPAGEALKGGGQQS